MMTRANLDQTQTPLLSTLQRCAERDYASFHTPGHKRGQGISTLLAQVLGPQVFHADLPELPELDNLFGPEGVIRESQELAAVAFGAEQTWFLTNGSTSGVIGAILATCAPGDKIILPRNVHQSAISGLILSGAVPIFVEPEYDPVLDMAHSITPEGFEQAIAAHPDSKAVMMVYPTYYGVCGDVLQIAQRAHQQGIPLLVDEAHGPHFAFHEGLPIAALAAEADLVVQSTHKVLSALTQAAMVHVQGSLIDRERLTRSLALVQSTSPNYLLLASLDAARHQMATQGTELMQRTLDLAAAARSHLSQLPHLSLLSSERATTPGFKALDSTRLTVNLRGLGIDGFMADEILNTQLGVTAELPTLRHLTFIISLGNTSEDIRRLIIGLTILAQRPFPAIAPIPDSRFPIPDSRFHFSPYVLPTLTPRSAFFSTTETVCIGQAVNQISAEWICPYPPGIPLLIPGERVTETAIAHLQQILATGGIITGCSDPSLETLRVVRSNGLELG